MKKKTFPNLKYSDLEQTFNKLVQENPHAQYDFVKYILAENHETREEIILTFFRNNAHLISKLPNRFKNFILASMLWKNNMDLITYLGLFAWFVILCIWHRTLAKVDKSLMEDHKFMKKQMDAVRDLNEKAKKMQELTRTDMQEIRKTRQ